MTVKPVIYRYTGAAPGTPAVITSLSLGTWDSNASLALYPVKRSTSTAYSYVATLAIGFESDPGTASAFRIWGALSGGSLDTAIAVKIAATLPDTYIQSTGAITSTGTTLASLYSVATEDFVATYTSGSPKIISGSDLVKTTGTGRFTKFIPIQIEVGASANLGAFPADPVVLRLGCSALES